MPKEIIYEFAGKSLKRDLEFQRYMEIQDIKEMTKIQNALSNFKIYCQLSDFDEIQAKFNFNKIKSPVTKEITERMTKDTTEKKTEEVDILEKQIRLDGPELAENYYNMAISLVNK